MLRQVISGGQTGVDRAALDAALEAGLLIGGWCPKGRRVEDGPIPDRYPLQKTETDSYPERTRRNVEEADATLILTIGAPGRGTQLTLRCCRRLSKPFMVVDLGQTQDSAPAAQWLQTTGVQVQNVAGPRESGRPGVFAQARTFLVNVFHYLRTAKTE